MGCPDFLKVYVFKVYVPFSGPRKGPRRLFRDFFQTLGGSRGWRLFSDWGFGPGGPERTLVNGQWVPNTHIKKLGLHRGPFILYVGISLCAFSAFYDSLGNGGSINSKRVTTSVLVCQNIFRLEIPSLTDKRFIEDRFLQRGYWPQNSQALS